MDKAMYNSAFVYRICLDEYTAELFKGRAFSSQSNNVIEFVSFDDFIIKMDVFMDIHGPQSYQDKRTFNNHKTIHSSFDLPQISNADVDRIQRQSGIKTTFTLILTSRRNAEWQGSFYKDDGTHCEFCNIIDLTKLISNNMIN